MVMLLQNSARTRTVKMAAAAPFICQTVYKNGTLSAPNDGATTDNGDGTCTVSFDAVDLDTIGDFGFRIDDAGGRNFFMEDEVWFDPIGYLANDGNAIINATQLHISNPAGTALFLEDQSNTSDVVVIQGGVNGIALRSIALAGILFDQCHDGLHFFSCGSGMLMEACVEGIYVMGATNIGFRIEATNGGIIAGADSGVGISGSGLLAGGQLVCTTGTPPTGVIAALLIRADGQAMRIQSRTDAAAVFSGALDGIRIAAAAGSGVLYLGVDLLVAIATTVLTLPDGVELGRTLRWALRVMLGDTSGKSSLTGNVRRYRDTNDTVDRVVATTDNFGQRTNVTYNA